MILDYLFYCLNNDDVSESEYKLITKTMESFIDETIGAFDEKVPPIVMNTMTIGELKLWVENNSDLPWWVKPTLKHFDYMYEDIEAVNDLSIVDMAKLCFVNNTPWVIFYLYKSLAERNYHEL